VKQGKKYLWDLKFVTLLQVLCEDFNELLGGNVLHGNGAMLVNNRHFDLVSVLLSYLTSIATTLSLLNNN